MNKSNLWHFASILACLTMASCANDAPDEETLTSDRKNEYTQAWIRAFGLIDASQDWCLVSAVQADVSINGKVAKVKIYNGNPADGAHLIGSVNTTGSLSVDVSEGTETVYARRLNASGCIVDEGHYPIVNGKVKIDGASEMPARALSRSRSEVQYAHTPSYFDAMIICEDLGSIGDYDFNDIVIGLKHTAAEGETPTLTIVPMAAGGVLATDIYFKNERLGEIHEMIDPSSSHTVMLNTTQKNIGMVTGMPYMTIDLSTYPDWTIANNWGDISIHVINKETTTKITAPSQGTAPQMICLGGDWFWPQEKLDIRNVYSGFKKWSCDVGAITWLGAWTDASVVKWNVPSDPTDPEDTYMWFKVTTTDSKPYTIRLNGSTTTEEYISGQTYYVTEPWTSCKDMFTVYSDELAYILDHDTENYIWGHPIASNNIKEVQFSDNFDMSAVTTMERMFAGCQNLTSVNVEEWGGRPATSLTNTDSMFKGCKSLSALDLSGWTVSGVDTFYDMFSGCTALKTLNLDGWSFKDGADLRYFIENTSGITIKCSDTAESKLSGTALLGGTSVSYTRP